MTPPSYILWISRCGHICINRYEASSRNGLSVLRYTETVCCACDGRYEPTCEVHREMSR